MDQRYFLNEWRFDKKNCNEESYEGYFLEADIQYLDQLHELHNNLPSLTERIKIEKSVAKFHDKTEYVIHIRNLKQTLNQGLVLKKIHREIKI